MSDTWQYRIRVTGPDRAAWFAKAKEGAWGLRSGSPMYSWSMDASFHDGKPSKTYKADANWFNVEVADGDHGAEFLGNCSGSPIHFFSKKDPFKWRVGPPLFGRFDIEVEIVGLSWSCDNETTGVSSYRDVYIRGEQTFTVEANDESIAQKYAPELVEKFPDDYTAEERAEMAAEDAEEREEETTRVAEYAQQQRETWASLLPGERVEAFRSTGFEAGYDAGEGNAWVVEKRVRARGHEMLVLRKHLDGAIFSGRRLEVSFGKVGLVRMPSYCEHGRDERTSTKCHDCVAKYAATAVMVVQMIDGLYKRPVC